MVVSAFDGNHPLTRLCREAFNVVETTLKEITAALPYLRLPPFQIPQNILQNTPLKMLKAVLAVGEPTLTPMATVAGAVAEATADWLFEQGASRVFTNNGGDIALRLAPGEKVRLGIVSDINTGDIDTVVTITAESGIRGVATSGLGGRSFTRGIANALTVFSHSCLLADALATHLANNTYIPSRQVITAKAGTIDPQSDIADLDVVVSVGRLSEKEINSSVNNLIKEAEKQYNKQLFFGMRSYIQNHEVCYPPNYLQKMKE